MALKGGFERSVRRRGYRRQAVLSHLREFHCSLIISRHACSLRERHGAGDAVRSLQAELHGKPADVLSGGDGLDLENQTCTPTSHGLAWISEKFDAVALIDLLLLPLIDIQRPFD